MNKLTTLTVALLFSAMLALPALAGNTEAPAPNQPPAQPPAQTAEQGKTDDVANDPHQSDAFKRQQAYVEKREAMRKHRDEALKIREQNAN